MMTINQPSIHVGVRAHDVLEELRVGRRLARRRAAAVLGPPERLARALGGNAGVVGARHLQVDGARAARPIQVH